MSVPKGSIVTYQAQSHTTFLDTSSDVVTAVAADLAAAGLTVVNSSIQNTSLIDQLGYGLSSSIPFTCTLQVQLAQDYASADDVKSVIDHFFYQETGDLPQSSSIPYIQQAGGPAQSTGQPAQAAPGGTAGPQTLTQSIGSFFSSITSGGTTMLALFCFGIIVALVLVTGAGGVARRAA